MGLTAVLNDTPEKATARRELLALLSGPESDVDIGDVLNRVYDAGLITDERIAMLCGYEGSTVAIDELDRLRSGETYGAPHTALRKAVKGELDRQEAAVDHD